MPSEKDNPFSLCAMLRFLFQFNGTATRKDWWITMLLTAVLEAPCALLCPWSPLLSGVMALLLVPALAVSARRMRSTGNHAEHCLFSFSGVAALLLLMPNLSEEILTTAQPFLVLLFLVGGIVALSHAIICGFVNETREA